MSSPAGSPYSLRDVVADGDLTGPRWMLHLVKAAQHAAPAFALWCLTGRPLLSSLIAGPGVYAVILGRKLWHWRIRDRQYSPGQYFVDWIQDGAIALLPIAGALIAGPRRVAGVAMLSMCLVVWACLHRFARP